MEPHSGSKVELRPESEETTSPLNFDARDDKAYTHIDSGAEENVERDNLGDESPEQALSLPSITLDDIQRVTGTIGGLIAVSYVVGFIIANSHLYVRYDVQNTSLLNARYLAVGLLYLLFAITVSLFAIGRQYLFNAGPNLGVVFTASISMLVPLILAKWFVPTGYTWDLILGIAIWALFSPFGIQIAVSSYMMWQRPPKARPDRKTLIFSPSRLLLIFILPLFAYTIGVYPYFSSAVGGGAPVTVSFVTDGQRSEVLEQMVPMESPYRTIDLKLLDQTDAGYLVLVKNTGSSVEQAVLVGKDLVQGVIYSESKNPVTLMPTPTPMP